MENKKKKQGFAAMDPNKSEQIRSMGGKAVSVNRAHMAEIGRKGGMKSVEVRRMKKDQNA